MFGTLDLGAYLCTIEKKNTPYLLKNFNIMDYETIKKEINNIKSGAGKTVLYTYRSMVFCRTFEGTPAQRRELIKLIDNKLGYDK